ncbi:hypothetical protein B0H34DRAFT_301387 [Crassisporium funariophilum]|nr:hypothetical protein B0H34DRAFT_301387 [Crassisporium funariophilum]
MTEYDYSPEAFERHLHKQNTIANWVDRTNQVPLRNPFTPATPAVQALHLRNDREYDSDRDDGRRHRRRDSHDHRDRHREKDTYRESERTRGLNTERSIQPSSSRPHTHTKRHRSASQSEATIRPPPTRTYTLPPQLNLQPGPQQYYPQQPSPTSSYPTAPYPQYPYPPKMTSPRDSKHSSRSSSTTRPQSSPTNYYPQQQPYTAPPYKTQRSQTSPNYAFPADSKYNRYGQSQVKQPPLLKRLFMGLTGGNKNKSHRVPRRKRSSSF